MIRAATMKDVPAIHRLITHHAERDRMLFRSHADLYEHLRDFTVFAEVGGDGQEQVIGCVAVALVWRDLAEIKSLAVDPQRLGQGIGTRLVQAAIAEGQRLELVRLFALTREEAFFRRLGFMVVPKQTLPHKVWTDCVGCPHRENCDEVAMVYDLVRSVSSSGGTELQSR